MNAQLLLARRRRRVVSRPADQRRSRANRRGWLGRMRETGESVATITKMLGISRAMFYRVMSD